MLATRLRLQHQDECRAKIQTSQLINVLQKHALSEEGEIPASRMKAIEILLKKSLPDLAQVTLEGGDTPVGVQVVSAEPMTPEQWALKHSPSK